MNLFYLKSFLFVWAVIAITCDGQVLPSNIPVTIFPGGKVVIPTTFTSEAYQKEAFKLVLREANQVANDMHLPEILPFTESNVVRSFVAPFGHAYKRKSVGNITTRNYTYSVSHGYKFSDLNITDLDSRCREACELYNWQAARIDTNGAYQLAVTWLRAAHMDVDALNRECKVQIEVNKYWNDIKHDEDFHKKAFVPIYDVYWLSAQNQAEHFGDVAFVELLAPTKTLFQFSIRDPKYVLRKPLVFTNLASLFPQTNIPVRYFDAKPITLPAPPP